ncbi:YdeI/OmpD-associated family protein [Niallia sp. Sow4_A1]|uniref:YdeI/OmpD-associated family protein n=1 Tax=unclassified Niallia TaxID=2837522 RepID=UPI002040B93B|nr:YdeI/OmpD-associated family protein [Niallia sp. MER TA 168]MCM3361044.1 YdeI/OmpD-associated family protein [Niallia sp. MER TA 168]
MAKTIVEKLNLKKYKKMAILNNPKETDYFSGLDEYDDELLSKYDAIFGFVLDMNEMREMVDTIIRKESLNKKGYIFLAYPKKGNKVYSTYIHRDELFSGLNTDSEGYVGESTIKFARMVGLDDVFTVIGLKEEEKKKKVAFSSKASQRVDDYIEKIPDIEKDLTDSPELLSFYQSLTPGYRKDWARYVYSAKQEGTREKRKAEMKIILQSGYKSRDIYKKEYGREK